MSRNAKSTRRLLANYSKKIRGRAPVALVTGGTSGMGLEYARQLAAGGCDIVLVSNQQEELERLRTAIADEFGVRVHARYSDLSLASSAEELLAWCDDERLEVDFLILNAGMYFFKELGPELMAGKAEAMLQLHVMTNTRLTVLFGERMKARGCGHILLVSSMTASLPMPGISVYAATKAYLKSFGRSMYFEFRPYGVGTTVVCPAAIATPLYNFNPRLMKAGLALGIIKTPEWLVSRALRAMLRHRRCISPSLMNLYLPALLSLLPNPTITKIWKRISNPTNQAR